jgi:hypothetical protein
MDMNYELELKLSKPTASTPNICRQNSVMRYRWLNTDVQSAQAGRSSIIQRDEHVCSRPFVNCPALRLLLGLLRSSKCPP